MTCFSKDVLHYANGLHAKKKKRNLCKLLLIRAPAKYQKVMMCNVVRFVLLRGSLSLVSVVLLVLFVSLVLLVLFVSLVLLVSLIGGLPVCYWLVKPDTDHKLSH